jgi:hypothetical protein
MIVTSVDKFATSLLRTHLVLKMLNFCVPISYREKIRLGGSEIIFFEYFFMVFSTISVKTDASLAADRNHAEKIRSHGQSR